MYILHCEVPQNVGHVKMCSFVQAHPLSLSDLSALMHMCQSPSQTDCSSSKQLPANGRLTVRFHLTHITSIVVCVCVCVCMCVLACVLRSPFLMNFRHKKFTCMFWVLDGKKIMKLCPSLVRIFFQNGLQIFRLCAQYIIIVIVMSPLFGRNPEYPYLHTLNQPCAAHRRRLIISFSLILLK